MSTAPDVRDSIVPAAVAGAAAFVLGYLLTWLLVGDRLAESFGDVPDWKGAAWYHFDAQFVTVATETNVGPFGGDGVLDLVGEGDATFLYVVAPLVLVAAGLAAARYVAAEEAADGALAGALLAAGYLPLAVVLALASAHTVSGSLFGAELSATVAVQLPGAVLVAGLAFPLVFGAAGGAAGAALGE